MHRFDVSRRQLRIGIAKAQGKLTPRRSGNVKQKLARQMATLFRATTSADSQRIEQKEQMALRV